MIYLRRLGIAGFGIALVCILWSTITATRFFEKALQLKEQRYLIAYPTGLVYCVFVLITVF